MSQAETNIQPAPENHASLMDSMYRYQRHIYDLTRKYYLLGRDRTINHLNMPFGGSLLEVGCGTGRNMLYARRRFPAAKLYGLDISQEMLTTARATFRNHSPIPDFHVADATAYAPTDFGVDGFDRIMISNALSMIPDWQGAIDASLRALNPGGELHIVDFSQQQGLPRWFRSGLQSWLRSFHVTPRAELREVLAERAERLGARLTFEEIGRGYACRAVIVTSRA